jgi:hypothetical protein
VTRVLEGHFRAPPPEVSFSNRLRLKAEKQIAIGDIVGRMSSVPMQAPKLSKAIQLAQSGTRTPWRRHLEMVIAVPSKQLHGKIGNSHVD